MNHRMIRLLALFAALALVLSACGDDDDSAATDDGAAQDDGGNADEGSSGEGDDASEDEAEDAAEDAIGDQASGDCGFLGEFATTGFDDAFESSDISQGAEGFKTLAEEFEEVAEAAPDEIEDAFSTLAEGMSTLASAFEDVDFSDPESFDPAVFEEIDDEKYEQASQEVEAWLEEHCPGIGG